MSADRSEKNTPRVLVLNAVGEAVDAVLVAKVVVKAWQAGKVVELEGLGAGSHGTYVR